MYAELESSQVFSLSLPDTATTLWQGLGKTQLWEVKSRVFPAGKW